jgi:hypothetical protein
MFKFYFKKREIMKSLLNRLLLSLLIVFFNGSIHCMENNSLNRVFKYKDKNIEYISIKKLYLFKNEAEENEMSWQSISQETKFKEKGNWKIIDNYKNFFDRSPEIPSEYKGNENCIQIILEKADGNRSDYFALLEEVTDSKEKKAVLAELDKL